MEKLSILRDAFSFSVPAARFNPGYKRWLQEKALGVPEEQREGWNGKISLVAKNGKLNVGLILGGTKELLKKGIQTKIVSWKNRPALPKQRHGFESTDAKYHYQNECVIKMLSAIPTGGGLVLAGTGSGKTKISAQLFSKISKKWPCLFIVDQIDLLYQSQKEIEEWLKKEKCSEKVGVVGNSKFEPQRITVATVQTLHKHKKNARFKRWMQSIELIIIDELHVQMSRRNFNVIDICKPSTVFGLTATMQMRRAMVRFKCWSICGPVIYEFPISKGVDQGVLTQGIVLQIPVVQNNKERKKVKKKEVTDYEHEVVNNKNLNNQIFALAKEGISQEYAIVVLAERVKHVRKLAKQLEEFSPRLCYGAIDVQQRKRTLRTFDKGKASLIIANKVFTKGINLKRVDCIIDVAQRKSKNDCVQKFGRGVRLHAQKQGLLYFSLFTLPFGEKAKKSQRGAFRFQKIPVRELTNRECAFGPKGIFRIGQKFLAENIKV